MRLPYDREILFQISARNQQQHINLAFQQFVSLKWARAIRANDFNSASLLQHSTQRLTQQPVFGGQKHAGRSRPFLFRIHACARPRRSTDNRRHAKRHTFTAALSLSSGKRAGSGRSIHGTLR